jgi:RimJ/RimL family protein N-acetyltransferase
MLNSQRLQLRKMVESDIEKYHSWRNDLDVMKTTSPSYLIIDDQKRFMKTEIDEWLKYQNDHNYRR